MGVTPYQNVESDTGLGELKLCRSRACSETVGFLSLLKDYQLHANGKVMSDASAALGIIKRQGLGRTRHIHTSYLWMQQVNERGINFSKVPGSENCADLFTKPLTRESAEHLSELVGMEFPEGHDEIAFTINFMGQSGRHISSSLQSIITAESWAEWHVLHLAKNESQVRMFPDIGKRWSIVEGR